MNNNFKRHIIIGSLAMGLITLLSASLHAQATVSWINTDVGGGDWNVGANWDLASVPNAALDDVANIGNGGTAFLAAPTFAVGGISIPNGTLEIRSGGTLVSQPGATAGTGAVQVGQGSNDSHLQVLGGGTFTAASLNVDAGSADTSVELSGTGSLTVPGNAVLERTTRITGNAATFGVTGNLTIGGNFTSEITDATTHTDITVGGAVTINNGAVLNLEFGGGVTPGNGDSWNLATGSTGVTGGFGSIVGPALGAGLGYKASAAAGNLSVSVGSVMTLKVNRATGVASLNGGADPIDMELYAIGSPGGHLTPGTWVSLDAAGFDSNSWLDGNPAGNPNGLAEARANPLGSSTFAASQVQAIGSILDPSGLAFAESQEDLTFTYLEPSSTILTNGIIEYEGDHNNLVLTVDPSTGDAEIHNQSAFDVSIGLYAITSESGALVHDVSETLGVGWDSFDETGHDGDVWQRGAGSAEVIVEANPASVTTIASGAKISIGTPWDMTTQDLTFEFLMIGSPGDFNDSGLIDGGDFLAWQRGESPSPISQSDLNDWEDNYGNAGGSSVFIQGIVEYGPIVVGSAVAAVPEPGSLTLFALGALASIVCCRSRKE